MADKDAKLAVYSLSDLKNTSDDAIANYLNSLKFKQDHRISDVRLALGWATFALAAACFYWDYKLGWDATKHWTAAAVAIYTVLNGALTFWIWGVEKDIVYAGISPDGEKIEISSSTKKNSPIYHLSVKIYAGGAARVSKTFDIARHFTEWFDAAGHFVPLPFQQMFAGEVPTIGKVDPLKVITAPGKAVQSTPIGSGADLQAAVDSIMTGASSGTSIKKGGKNRKKV